MYLIFDTETTGLPKRWDAPLSDSENWPRCVQLAWQTHNKNGELVSQKSFLIKPDGFSIPYESEKVHGISTALADKQGASLQQVLDEFYIAVVKSEFLVGHNISFDRNILGAEFLRLGLNDVLAEKKLIDTCNDETANLCKIKGGRGGKFKFPTLSELYVFVFKENFDEAHNAAADVEATSRIFLELLRLDKLHPSVFENQKLETAEILEKRNPFQLIGLNHQNFKLASNAIKNEKATNKIDNAKSI